MRSDVAGLFSLEPSIAYLNHGSFGAVPRVVRQAQRGVLESIERNPHEFFSERYQELIGRVRATLASTYNCTEDDLVLSRSVTEAASAVVASLALSPGDEVVASGHEYSSNMTALRQQCAASGARLIVVGEGLRWRGLPSVDIIRAFGDRTRAVLLSHISSSTATCLDVAAVIAAARTRGIVSIVDGAHAPGHLDLDLDAIGADIYLGALHKWAMFPRGAAFFVVRRGLDMIVYPVIKSWYFEAASISERFSWLGTTDPTAWLVADEVFGFQERAAAEGWYAAARELSGQAEKALCQLPGVEVVAAGERRAPYMFAVTIPAETTRLRRELRAAGIWAWTGDFAGQSLLRVSTFVYNDESDVDRLLTRLQEIITGLGEK